MRHNFERNSGAPIRITGLIVMTLRKVTTRRIEPLDRCHLWPRSFATIFSRMPKKKIPSGDLSASFVASVRTQLASQKITQAELARRLKIRPSVVSRLLTGGHIPTLDVVERISDALDCNVDLRLRPKR